MKVLENSSFFGFVYGGDNTGGLVGYNADLIINNSWSRADVNGRNYVGGLVGTSDMHIYNSYAISRTTGTLDWVGGLVGVLWFNVNITGSRAGGNVEGGDFVGGLVGGYYGGRIDRSTAGGNVTGDNFLGGLVGEDWDNIITDSSSTGNVTSRSSDAVGGLIGFHTNSLIRNVWASGAVSGTSNVGGLIGQNGFTTATAFIESLERISNTGKIIKKSSLTSSAEALTESRGVENAYSIGEVIGTTDTGGLIGANSEICTNNFWDTETSGQASSSCGEGKTTSEMQNESTYEGWDFENTWFLEPSGYPCLRWQKSCGDGDGDGDLILDKDDKCPDTPLDEEQVVYGCSCDQILDLKPGEDTTPKKCSKGIINVFTKAVGWAKILLAKVFGWNKIILSFS